MRTSIEELENKRTELSAEILKTKRKIKKMHTETITILGIFAAIVITFAGGISLTGSSLQSMASTNPFKIAFVLLICGFILFNTIMFLMGYMNRITSELHSDEIDDAGILSKRNKAVVIFDIVLILLFVIDVCLWYMSGTPFT